MELKALSSCILAFLLVVFIHSLVSAQSPSTMPSTADAPPELRNFSSDKTIAVVGETVVYTAVAGDDNGVARMHFSTPVEVAKDCTGETVCIQTLGYMSSSSGPVSVCAWAEDSSGQLSPKQCLSVDYVADKPPLVTQFEAGPNPAYPDAIVNYTVEAVDDVGLKALYVQDRSTGMISECQCAGAKECSSKRCGCTTPPCFSGSFATPGIYKFCSWAVDSIDQESAKKCIDVNVTSPSKCTQIRMDDTHNNLTVAVKIETKKIYENESGFTGYPVECCPYCLDLVLNTTNCEKIKGNFGVDLDYTVNYTLKYFAPGDKVSFSDLNYTDPYVVCENIKDDVVVVGLVDGAEFQVVDYIYNANQRRYWFIETKQAPKPVSYIYVANSAMESVGKLDTNDGSLMCEYLAPMIGENPSRTAVSLTGDAWVGNRASGDVSWMDGKTCRVKARIPVGYGPRGMIVDFDGNLWVGNYNGDDLFAVPDERFPGMGPQGTVWKIDGKTGKCLLGDPSRNPDCPEDGPSIYVGNHPYGGAIDCSGNLFIVARPDHLVKINVADASIAWNKSIVEPVSHSLYGISLDSKGSVWVAEYGMGVLGGISSGGVYKIDSGTGDIMCQASFGGNGRGVSVDEDDNVWIADSGTDRVHKVDNDCNVLMSLSLPGCDTPIGVSSDYDRHMWVVCQDTNNAFKLGIEEGTIEGAFPTSGLISPNPYCYSDMTGYGLYHTCFGRTSLTEKKDDRYFFAEQLVDGKAEEKTTTVVDALNYSTAVYNLLYEECYHREPDSLDCRQMCVDPPDGGAPVCANNPNLRCPSRCFPMYNYSECTYRKYQGMYGRPYVDYLECHKTPLKDTAWCRQKSILPTSSIAYPWYSFAVDSVENMSLRGFDAVDDGYVEALDKWNDNVDMAEMPDPALIPDITLTPERSCTFSRDNKLFRSVWVKVFTVTPFLEDERNKMFWTRSGAGTLYAGGGFKRENPCYWDNCALCGPGGGTFDPENSDVEAILRIKIPDSYIGETFPLYSRTSYFYYRDMRSNGPLTIISSSNQRFVVSGAEFEEDESAGEYVLRLKYRPIDGDRPFNVVQDIKFDYNTTEAAKELTVEVSEEFRTSLGGLETDLSVSDYLGKRVDISQDKIAALKEAAQGFINVSLAKKRKVGLVAYSGDEGRRSPPHPQCMTNCITSSMELTDDAAALYRHVEQTYRPMKWTCTACGIDRARELLNGSMPENKSIILLSDGEETSRSHITGLGALQAAALAATEGIRIYTVALGDEVNKKMLQDIATATGGQYFEISCNMLLQDIYTRLAGKIDNAVLVSDLSSSMEEPLSLRCASNATRIIHEDILKDLKINITGVIVNEAGNLTVARGLLNVTVEPDILNRFTLSAGGSKLDYFSLIYPVKHDLYKKETSSGPIRKIYRFEDSYGYEDPAYNYPAQCRNICPLDCTCPDDDITDVTCPDGKRDDCVCLPPTGQSYKTPCTSSRNFHEDELDYYDFVSLYTLDTSKVQVLDREPQNVLFSGDLSGTVSHVTSSDVDGGSMKRILLYTTAYEPSALKSRLEDEGYIVDIINRADTEITAEMLFNHTQVWYLDYAGDTDLAPSEISALLSYHRSGRGLLFSGRNVAAKRFGVDMESRINDTSAIMGCADVSVPYPHPALRDVASLTGLDGVNMTTSLTSVDIIGFISVSGMEYPYVMIDESGGAGRMLFDSSAYRFLWPENCNNYKYASNIAGWLFDKDEETLEAAKTTYMLNFSALSFPYPLTAEDLENSNITLYVHFRNDPQKQTYNLLPARTEGNLYVNVSIKNPAQIAYTIEPRKHDLSEGTNISLNITLIDTSTWKGIPGRNLTVEVTGYKRAGVVSTDSQGNALYSFIIGGKDTTVRITYDDDLTPAEELVYLSVSNLSMLWWFASPEVLLLLIVLVFLALSYKWFREGRLDLNAVWDELLGKKQGL